MSDDLHYHELPEDGSYYDDDYEDDYDGDVDPDYEDSRWPDPDPSLMGKLKRLIVRLRWRWYAWRHKDETSDIPF